MTRMHGWTVEVCDSNWVRRGEVQELKTLGITERSCGVGAGWCDAPWDGFNCDVLITEALLQSGFTLIIREDGKFRQAASDVDIEVTRSGSDAAGYTQTLKLAWRDSMKYLWQRIIYPDPRSPWGSQSAEYDRRSGPTGTVIAEYVRWNAGDAALVDRRIPGLKGLFIGEDLGSGAYLGTPVDGRFQIVGELARELAISGGVTFGIDLDDRQHTLTLRQVENRSGTVVFSDSNRSLLDGSWWMKTLTANVNLAGGKGDLLARELVEVTTTDELAALRPRAESFFDMTNGEGDALRTAAERDLATKGPTFGASYALADGPWKYRRDFQLGDLIGIEPRPGWVLVKPVIEVATTVNDSGVTVRPLAGDYQATSGTQAEQVTKRLIQTVAGFRSR